MLFVHYVILHMIELLLNAHPCGACQRDCRKTEILQVTAGQALELSPRTRVERGDRLKIGLYQCPEHVDFADIVYQSE